MNTNIKAVEPGYNTRPSVPLPEAGTKHSIKIDYSGTTLNVTLDGQDLFGPVTLSNDVNNLLTGKEAVKLGAFGGKNSQVLIELGDAPGDGGTDPGDGGTVPGMENLSTLPITNWKKEILKSSQVTEALPIIKMVQQLSRLPLPKRIELSTIK